tara:strand:+ start:2579 stop:3595 length:1017 start_codon:yes stop_codon:yes gene_type:complete
MNKISKYIFTEIFKGFFLVLFIFISITWLLQFTRLISLTNLIQVDILTIFYLSLFLIPNLLSVILPFVIIFGLIITFLKLFKDREIISIYSLGLHLKSIRKSFIFFSIFLIIIIIFLNFFISPSIYKKYKIKEFEIRNSLNFEKVIISNFIKINNDTYLDFEKENNSFKDIFIKFNSIDENIVYAKKGDIYQEENLFKFKLKDGYRITLFEDNKIEKLEFDNYVLEISKNQINDFAHYDNNTFDVFQDIENKNYNNIIYKIADSVVILFIIFSFYFYNVIKYKFDLKNIFFYTTFSITLLIINQIIKNSELSIKINLLVYLCTYVLFSSVFLIKNKNV